MAEAYGKGFTKTKIIDLQQVAYYVQRRNQATGQWESIGPPIRGWGAAYQALWIQRGRAIKRKVTVQYRVISKREAEKYREAWKDAYHFFRFGEPRGQVA